MKEFNLVVAFGQPGYIADPYWPERYKLINIQKESGLNRARSSANRRKALEGHLSSIGMTLDEYFQLEADASRPFYRQNGEASAIIIPTLHIYGFLVATASTTRAAGRACRPEQVRTSIQASEWTTDKTEADGVYERFVSVTAGTGQKLSNQKAFRSNPFISEFRAEGTMRVDPTFVEPQTLRSMLEYGGREVGIGASRKLGYGRFSVLEFKEKEMEG